MRIARTALQMPRAYAAPICRLYKVFRSDHSFLFFFTSSRGPVQPRKNPLLQKKVQKKMDPEINIKIKIGFD